jgi:hypothetical protein
MDAERVVDRGLGKEFVRLQLTRQPTPALQ